MGGFRRCPPPRACTKHYAGTYGAHRRAPGTNPVLQPTTNQTDKAMTIDSKKDLQQHLGRTGFFTWKLRDDSRIVASGSKAVSTDDDTRPWTVRHEAANGEVMTEETASSYRSAGSKMWRLAHQHDA